MSKEKTPSFKFYIRDWAHGTRLLSYAQKGFFIELLCDQWDYGFIKATEDGLPANYKSKEARRLFEGIKDKFVFSDGKLINSKLERVRIKSETFSQIQSEKGKQGGRPRKPNESQTIPEQKPNKTLVAHANAIALKGGTGGKKTMENYSDWIKLPDNGLLYDDLKRKATTYNWRGIDFQARLDKFHYILNGRDPDTKTKYGNDNVTYYDEPRKIHDWFVNKFCEPNPHPTPQENTEPIYEGNFFKRA